MPRIRTIKPEFPEDETLGRVSRDARLLFVLIWTRADDYGRFRASPAYLRGQLYPFDDDVTNAMVGVWLQELCDAGRVRTYVVREETYAEVSNWSRHQRIDNAGKPFCPSPPFAETLGESRSEAKPSQTDGESHGAQPSPTLAESRGGSPLDLDLDPEQEQEHEPKARAQIASADVFAGAVEKLLLLRGKPEAAKTKSDPAGWLAGARKGIRAELHDQAAELLAADPTLTVDALTDALVPAESRPRPGATEFESDGVGRGVPMPDFLRDALKAKNLKNLKSLDDTIGPET